MRLRSLAAVRLSHSASQRRAAAQPAALCRTSTSWWPTCDSSLSNSNDNLEFGAVGLCSKGAIRPGRSQTACFALQSLAERCVPPDVNSLCAVAIHANRIAANQNDSADLQARRMVQVAVAGEVVRDKSRVLKEGQLVRQAPLPCWLCLPAAAAAAAAASCCYCCCRRSHRSRHRFWETSWTRTQTISARHGRWLTLF